MRDDRAVVMHNNNLVISIKGGPLLILCTDVASSAHNSNSHAAGDCGQVEDAD